MWCRGLSSPGAIVLWQELKRLSLIKFTCAFLHPVLNRRSLGDSTQDVLGPIAESRANSAAGSEIRRRRTSEKTGSHDAGISMVAVGTTIAALSPALIRELPHPSLILESSVNAHDGSGPRNSLLDEHAPQQTLQDRPSNSMLPG